MRQYINKLDPYWSGKIAGEYIREYENETALNRMEAAIESFVKDNHEKIAIAVLDENIDIICAETVKAV